MHVFRPEPEPPAEPSIYLEGDGLPSELWRGVEIALAGYVPEGRIMFEGGEAEWEEWCAGPFATLVVPKLVQAREAGHLGVREWSAIDSAFGAALGSGDGAARSLRAGRNLAERHAGARHFQALDRLRRNLLNNPQAGHAGMVVAFLSAQFNVATTACLVACLFLEWRCAFPAKPERAFESMTPMLGRWLPLWLGSGSFPALQSPPAG